MTARRSMEVKHALKTAMIVASATFSCWRASGFRL
jgi:hypothetical protein